MISSGWRSNQCPACFSWNLASPGWSSGLGPTNLRSFLNQRAVPQRTSIGWEQDGRRMLGPSLPKSSWANMKYPSVFYSSQLSLILSQLEMGLSCWSLSTQLALFFLSCHLSCLCWGNSSALLEATLKRQFSAKVSLLLQADLLHSLFTASNSFSYRISSRLWLGLRYRLTFPLGYIGSMQQWDWELGSVLKHRVN